MVYGLLGVAELSLSLICIVPYSVKLYKIYKQMNKEKESHNKNPQLLLNVIKKQGKLSFVTYGTTFLLFALLANVLSEQGIVQSFGYVDTIINGMCVYCTFDFSLNKQCYRYLCNCNGIRSLQWIFCFCCCCCNVYEGKTV